MLATLAKRLKTTSLITSCGKGQAGMDDSQQRRGLFAWHIASGFRGPADADADGHVSGSELFDYLTKSLQAESQRLGGAQTPGFSAPR